MQEILSLQIQNKEKLVEALIALSTDYDDFCLLNSNDYPDKYGKFDLLCALGSLKKFGINEIFQKKAIELKEWMFLHISYELKNELERLSSKNPDNVQFDEISAFVPKYLFQMERNSKYLKVFSHSKLDEGTAKKLQDLLNSNTVRKTAAFPKVESRLNKEAYLQKIETLKSHIQRGNIYEANFCMEFFAEHVEIPAEEMYLLLNDKAPAPFSAFYKQKDKYLISASPERFLAKRGKKMISQPMKGTIRRGKDIEEDEILKKQLHSDPKEQTENVMIVDVTRNDLSRIAEKGSVQLEELFGIYSFPQVHQLISTVSCLLKKKSNVGEVIKACFPMASMTGAPKISAMDILDKEEVSCRNLYSGSVGYFSPNGDFDLNVVIRSLLYNRSKKYLSYSTGGAITAMSDAEMEYKECLLKAKAIFD